MSTAYNLIKEFYGDRTALRSGVPLMNHIDEGLLILEKLKASDIVKDAYCLHPILQSDEALTDNILFDFKDVSTTSIILAMEYRRVANSYLSNMSIKGFVGFTFEAIRFMLIADKVQNYKDFMEYHYGKHERSVELYTYFHNWFNLLEIKYEDYENLVKEAVEGE